MAAAAGVNTAILVISSTNGAWRPDGTPHSLKVGEAVVEITVTAESGKIDLNTADPALLMGLLMVAGLGPGGAEALTDDIVAWRTLEGTSENSINRPRTAFSSIAEIMQLPGMTADLFDRLAPNLTIYSGSPAVNVDLAPKEVLLALSGNTEADAEGILQQRSLQETTPDQTKNLSQIIGQAFSITASAKLPEGTTAYRTEIVRLTGNPKQPVWVLTAN
jgi:general secretion pathway protein K